MNARSRFTVPINSPSPPSSFPLPRCHVNQQVTDLEVQLVDRNGFPAHVDPKGVKVMVTPRGSLPGGAGGGGGAVHSPRGGKKNAAKKDLSKRATHDPQLTMPRFVLDQKLAGEQQQAGKSEKERLARIAKEGVALVVHAEGSGLDIAAVSLGRFFRACCLVTGLVTGVLLSVVRQPKRWYLPQDLML